MKQLTDTHRHAPCRTMIVAMKTAALLALGGCASNGKKDEAQPVNQEDYPTLAIDKVHPVNQKDYPTLETVEYIIECMNKKGGQNYTTLYQCTCQFDKVAEKLSYDEYSQAIVFRNLKSMPGEKGAVFRDPPQAKIMRNKLKQAQKQAQQECEMSQNTANSNK